MNCFGLKRFLLFFNLIVILSFTLESENPEYGITINKTIKKISDGLYQVAIEFHNGEFVNGIAKYEAKLPLSADFVKEVSKDQTLNLKVDKRKIKVIWMHLRNNNTYSTVFQLRSKKSIYKLKMYGDFYAHKEGRQFTLKDTTSFIVE
jgi:hypothetical protein